MRRQVTCITKPSPLSVHEHITHVGNPTVGWVWTVEKVIKAIEDRTDTFYVVDPKTYREAEVKVVYRRITGKPPYIQTYADGDWKNNLLSLNQCPLLRR